MTMGKEEILEGNHRNGICSTYYLMACEYQVGKWVKYDTKNWGPFTGKLMLLLKEIKMLKKRGCLGSEDD